MTTQLQLYNIALRSIGATPLESMSEDLEKRRALDAAGDLALEDCLRSGFWNFAMRVTQREPDAIQRTLSDQASQRVRVVRQIDVHTALTPHHEVDPLAHQAFGEGFARPLPRRPVVDVAGLN